MKLFRGPSGKVNFLPFASLLIVLLITISGFLHLRNIREERRKEIFEERVERAERAIEGRIIDYNQILLGAKAFVEESDTVTREEWKKHFEIINVDRNYPGIQGIGYSIFIEPENLEQHEEFIRRQGFPDYQIIPEGERTVYSSIIYLEPFSGANLRAFGFDMFSEPVRRKAMLRAMKTGNSALSGKVTLVQEITEDVQPGFLLYVPVYGNMPEQVEDKRPYIEGYVYNPFRSYDVFDAILKDRFSEITFEIYDGDTINEESLLYYKTGNKDVSGDIGRELLSKTSVLNIFGNTWTIRYSTSGMLSETDENLPFIVLCGGFLFSILIFILMILQGRTQSARKIASEMNAARNFIIEAMPEKVSLADKDGNITYINKNWKDYTGMSIEAFKNAGRKDIIHPKDIQLTEAVLKESFSFGKNFNIEHRLKRKDGLYKWHLTLGTPQKDENNNIISWVETHTDIHEQKSQLEELKKINSDLDNFVYTASHDLKAPISNMEGILETIYDETKEQCTESVINLYDMIDVSIQRLKVTISDLTEISRIQRGYESQTEVVNIKTILEEFIQDHKSMIEKNQATINADLSILEINFSRRNFRSILNNLVSNAIKYRSSERAPKISLSTQKVGESMELIVSDNGLGLDPNQKDKIFGMFKRMHTHVEGSGIGLYIVKRIIENAGGEIEVEGEEGKGTTFKIYLPLKKMD